MAIYDHETHRLFGQVIGGLDAGCRKLSPSEQVFDSFYYNGQYLQRSESGQLRRVTPAVHEEAKKRRLALESDPNSLDHEKYRLNGKPNMKAIAGFYGVRGSTVSKWAEKGAPILDPEKLAEWRKTPEGQLHRLKTKYEHFRPFGTCLYRVGVGCKAISKRYGVTEAVPRKWIQKAGIMEHERRRYPFRLDPEEKRRRNNASPHFSSV